MTMAKKHAGSIAVTAMLIGPAIPGAYMAITGHAPMWARVWYCVWLALWLLVTVAKAAKADR